MEIEIILSDCKILIFNCLKNFNFAISDIIIKSDIYFYQRKLIL